MSKDVVSEDVGSKGSHISHCTGHTEEINEEQLIKEERHFRENSKSNRQLFFSA